MNQTSAVAECGLQGVEPPAQAPASSKAKGTKAPGERRMRFSNSPDDLSMVAALKAMKILGLGGIIGGGGMTTIEILTVQMNKLSEIDMINQTFAAQFFISCRIPDGALDADLCNPSAELPMRSDGYPVHKPSAAWFITQFDFNNALSVSLLNEQVLTVGDDLLLNMRFEGVWMEVFMLRDFPFDTQPITIALAINCRTTGKTPVRLCVAEDVTTHNLTEEDFFLSEIYDLGKADEIYVRTGFCGGRGRSFPVAYITMAITRKPEYYMHSVVLPMMLFVAISTLVWYIPPWDVADRLNFGLAMLLTVIAFKFSNASLLPAVSYLTLLDRYVLLGTFMCALPIFEAAIVYGQLHRHQIHTEIDVAITGSASGELHFDRTSYVGPIDERGPLGHLIPREPVPVGMKLMVVDESTYDFIPMERVYYFDKIFWWVTMVLWFVLHFWIVWKYLVNKLKRKRFVPPSPRTVAATGPVFENSVDQDDHVSKEHAWRADIRSARKSGTGAVTATAVLKESLRPRAAWQKVGVAAAAISQTTSIGRTRKSSDNDVHGDSGEGASRVPPSPRTKFVNIASAAAALKNGIRRLSPVPASPRPEVSSGSTGDTSCAPGELGQEPTMAPTRTAKSKGTAADNRRTSVFGRWGS